jgi:hypothetical protein
MQIYIRDHMVEVFRRFIDCGSRTRLDDYTEIQVRPADRTPAGLHYFIDGRPSTCATSVLGLWRLVRDARLRAGLLERLDHVPELDDPYVMQGKGLRIATTDVQSFAGRQGAWISTRNRLPALDELPHRGDAWLIDSNGYDSHVGVAISDPYGSGPNYKLDCIEGGQGPDSTYIRVFEGVNARVLSPRGNAIYMGRRMIWGVANADLLFPAPAFDGPTADERSKALQNAAAAARAMGDRPPRDVLPPPDENG